MPGMQPKRCSWVNVDDTLMREYHDREWGVPTHDDRTHFEFLILETAQAGLSWSIVLKKRDGYRRAFSEFDPGKVARHSAARIDKLAAAESDAFSCDLKHRGFSFVGSTVIYAHMQAVGMVNGHVVDRYRYRDVHRLGMPT
jgi:3-methyladenine DNA glycosylase Tag